MSGRYYIRIWGTKDGTWRKVEVPADKVKGVYNVSGISLLIHRPFAYLEWSEEGWQATEIEAGIGFGESQLSVEGVVECARALVEEYGVSVLRKVFAEIGAVEELPDVEADP